MKSSRLNYCDWILVCRRDDKLDATWEQPRRQGVRQMGEVASLRVAVLTEKDADVPLAHVQEFVVGHLPSDVEVGTRTLQHAGSGTSADSYRGYGTFWQWKKK